MNVRRKLSPEKWEGEYESEFDCNRGKYEEEIIPAVRIGSRRE
jgi:hypothetical protein